MSAKSLKEKWQDKEISNDEYFGKLPIDKLLALSENDGFFVEGEPGLEIFVKRALAKRTTELNAYYTAKNFQNIEAIKKIASYFFTLSIIGLIAGIIAIIAMFN